MEATFYKYGSNYKGYYIQTEKIDKVEQVTKKDLMKIADLRHPVLSRSEFYNVLSIDIKGRPLKEFSLMTSTHYIIVRRK